MTPFLCSPLDKVMVLWSFIKVLKYYSSKTEEIYFLWLIWMLLGCSIRHTCRAHHVSLQHCIAFTFLTSLTPGISKSTLEVQERAKDTMSAQSKLILSPPLQAFPQNASIPPGRDAKETVTEHTQLAHVTDLSILWHHKSFLLTICYWFCFYEWKPWLEKCRC